MVTVIAKEEEFSSPVHNGSNNGANEHERRYSNIKDYQEVNFHLSPSFKIFPDDLFAQTALNGEFFVQIDEIQSIEQSNSFVLTLTDGIQCVQAVTNGEIPHLNGNVKSGCKLLLTGVVPLTDGFLQLTSENTKFQFGSRTYPRPRSAYRGRGGSSRPSYEGRRGGGGNGYHRHDPHASETNFFKRPPAKNTLMDFMTTLNISRDSKTPNEEEKRRNLSGPTDRPAEVTSTGDSNEAVISDSTDFSEQFDPDDDPTQSIYRERRNPLPPRLQRAQEERSRRNTIRQYDENLLIPAEEINGDFPPGTTQHQSLMSSPSSAATSYFRPSDLRGYFPPHSSILQPYPTAPTYVTYIPTNSGHFPYNISNGAYPTYSNENFAFCYGHPFGPVTYLQAAPLSTEPTMEQNDSAVNNESQIEESNSSERAEATGTSQSSSNDENSSTKKFVNEQKNFRPRWKVNDVCLARWSEDRQFYAANILQIQPPFATVIFLDYQNCEQVHFSDLRPLPREQHYSSSMNPVSNVSTSDLNPLAASAFYPTSIVDPCVLMPEAPPFPFNSAGTVHLYPTTVPILSRSNRSASNSQRRTDFAGETTIVSAESNEKKNSEENAA